MEWDLTVLYKGFDDPKLDDDIQRLEREISAAVEAFAQLDEKADACGQMEKSIRLFARIASAYSCVQSYIMLTLAVDATNAQALKRLDRVTALSTGVERMDSALSRFAGRIKDIDAIIASSPLLSEHEFILKKAKEQSAHLIDEVIEPAVLQMQLTGGKAFEQLRDMLDGTLTVEVEEDGQLKSIPLSAARNLAYSPDAATRKAAYEAELKAYPKTEIPMAACLNAIKGEALTLCNLKKYDSPLAQTLSDSNMERATLDAMWQAITEYAPKFRAYMKAKARYLGHDGGLPFYDIFAPLGKEEGKYNLDAARDYLIDVLGQFSKKMADFVRRAFDERWIDSEPKQGKQGGAFCAELHPLGVSRILTNFDGSFSDVLTLAHELGHGYHNECMKELSILNANPPMPLAETASIFNETLVLSAELRRAPAEVKLALIESELTEANQVILDIYSRYLFETELFENRKDRSMTPDELKELMRSAQKQAYGDGLNEEYLHPYMWACKSHYYSTGRHFYNFPYAFGLLFGKGVYAQYLQMGESFLPQYDALLAACGRDSVRGVAARMGIEINDASFWRSSLQVLSDSIDAFIGLADRG